MIENQIVIGEIIETFIVVSIILLELILLLPIFIKKAKEGKHKND